MSSARQIAELCSNPRELSPGGYSCQCPAHDDKHNSLSVHDVDWGVLVHCHAGCSQRAVIERLKSMHVWPGGGAKSENSKSDWECLLPVPSDAPPPPAAHMKHGLPSARYEYRDEAGKTIFYVCRFDKSDGKVFAQLSYCRNKVGKQAWQWKSPPRPRPLFGLDRLVQSPDAPVLWCEGEKACLAAQSMLPDYVAIASSGGAANVHCSDFSPLDGRRVVVWPDADTAGQAAGVRVALVCTKCAASDVLLLSPPADKPKGWDAADAVADGWTEADFQAFLATADKPESKPNSVPVIPTGSTQFHTMEMQAWKALERSNAAEPVPRVYRRGDTLTYVGNHDDDRCRMVDMTPSSLKGYLAEHALWVKSTMMDDPKGPPDALVRTMLQRHEVPDYIPRLDTIRRTPFLSKSGRLVLKQGYHPDDRILLDFRFSLDEIPGDPTRQQIRQAAARLRDVFVDFPFATEADEANAIALLLLPVLRPMIDGPVPFFFVNSSVARSGKGKIANAVSILATGEMAPVGPLPAFEEERRKRITSAVMADRPIVVFDNCRVDKLESESLEALATSTRWVDRLLGSNQLIELPNSPIWVFTSVNPAFNIDLAGRIVPIRLEPHCARPETRSDFVHDPFEAWVIANRAQLVHAALLLVQAWIAAEYPEAHNTPRMGGYEHFRHVVGGILTHARIYGFLENRRELLEGANQEAEVFASIVTMWSAVGGEQTVGSLLDILVGTEELEYIVDDAKEKGRETRMGQWLTRNIGRVANNYMLKRMRVKSQGRTQYALARIRSHADRQDIEDVEDLDKPHMRSDVNDDCDYSGSDEEGPSGPSGPRAQLGKHPAEL